MIPHPHPVTRVDSPLEEDSKTGGPPSLIDHHPHHLPSCQSAVFLLTYKSRSLSYLHPGSLLSLAPFPLLASVFCDFPINPVDSEYSTFILRAISSFARFASDSVSFHLTRGTDFGKSISWSVLKALTHCWSLWWLETFGLTSGLSLTHHHLNYVCREGEGDSFLITYCLEWYAPKPFESLLIQGHLYILYLTLVTGVPWLRNPLYPEGA